ncbi:MAG: 2-iminoacetate synthase ThiH, partial [Candidatus Orphnella occulta]|nr:2-iminoacetate synthase ThiH [Candidatus Orphnella occulta]
MSFINLIKQYEHISLQDGLDSITAKDIESILSKDILTPKQFLALLSPNAVDYLEDMAQKAHKITLKNFGKTIQLYTPMYLSNYCDNHCIYCGFNVNEKS